MTCTHPVRDLELLDCEFSTPELQKGSTLGFLYDLVRGKHKLVAKVKCRACGEHFDMIKITPFEQGDWSKLMPGTLDDGH